MTATSRRRPIAIDLFAGAGGMSLGFEQAGFDVVAAVEIDPVHCAVHKYNFPNCVMIPISVAELTAREIRKRAGIGRKKVQCVFGGPPCQGFSLIGHRTLEDPRNKLVLEFVRVVSELDAETFVFENVKGLTVGRHKAFLEELVSAFDAVGYEVRLPWRVLDAAYFGVPQHRERLILLGAKKGRKLPEYPALKFNPADAKKTFPKLPRGPTCGDALRDLPNADQFDRLIDSDATANIRYGSPSQYALELRCQGKATWHFGHRRKWDPNELTSSARTSHSAISQRRFGETSEGEVEPISRFFKLSRTGLSNTLRAGTDGARGAFTSPRPIHYSHSRCVTVREMARLHGFPDWFRLHSTKWHGARQIGNAVPPPLAKSIAESIVSALELKPSRPSKSISLGDIALLGFDMSAAAKHFGVATPNGRRDRKSGAKKRKQHETEEQYQLLRVANG